jgi:repressor of nif and glnA expression
MSSMDQVIREQARLVILKELAKQADETLNSDLIVETLKPFGIRKTREWVHGEFSFLNEMGAITLTRAGSIQVATLTELGARHLKRETVIEGVRRPSRPGSADGLGD